MAAEGSCFKCAKATLFGFNFIFWLVALCLLGVGTWMRMDPGLLERQGVAKLLSDAMSIGSGGIILIAVAAIGVVLGFFGCCGAAKESRCMLGFYITIMLIILFAQFMAATCGIFAVTVFKTAFEEKIRVNMIESLHQSYSTVEVVTEAWDLTQKEMKCCGVYGPIDYKDSNWYYNRTDPSKDNSIPVTCCATNGTDLVNFLQCQQDAYNIYNSTYPVSKGSRSLNLDGCYGQTVDVLIDYSKILVGICIGVGALELMCLIMAVLLCCNVGRYSYDYE